MKRNIVAVICSILLLVSTMAFAAKDEFNFRGFFNNYEYTIKFIGAFTKPAEVNPGEAIIFYVAKSIKYPLDLWSGADYIFIGRTGENTYQLSHNSTALDKGKTINCYFDKNNPSEMELEVPFIYVPNPNKERFKLRVIDLKGNKLVYQIIVPEYMKPYLSK